jgi:acetyltransferase-like isoleucine patch superfamily enzyme
MLRRLHIRLAQALGYRRGPLWMSALRKRWVLLRHPHADIRFDGPVYLGPGFSLHIPENGSFHVGPGVEFRRGFRCEIVGDGRVTIGAGSVFTYYVLIQCSTSIDIGERVMFGQSTMVVDGNHRFRDLDKPMLTQGYDYRPVCISDDVTITTKCTIISDVGERAFVGANSVVTRPVPPFTVVAGVPARVLDSFGPAEPPPTPRGTPAPAAGDS